MTPLAGFFIPAPSILKSIELENYSMAGKISAGSICLAIARFTEIGRILPWKNCMASTVEFLRLLSSSAFLRRGYVR